MYRNRCQRPQLLLAGLWTYFTSSFVSLALRSTDKEILDYWLFSENSMNTKIFRKLVGLKNSGWLRVLWIYCDKQRRNCPFYTVVGWNIWEKILESGWEILRKSGNEAKISYSCYFATNLSLRLNLHKPSTQSESPPFYKSSLLQTQTIFQYMISFPPTSKIAFLRKMLLCPNISTSTLTPPLPTLSDYPHLIDIFVHFQTIIKIEC